MHDMIQKLTLSLSSSFYDLHALYIKSAIVTHCIPLCTYLCRSKTNTPEDNSVNSLSHIFAHPFACCDAEDEVDLDIPSELTRLVEQEERVIHPHQENLELVNLGSSECPKEVKVGSFMSSADRKDLVALLHEFCDVFAWSYQDMPGLERSVIEHRLPLKPECPPVQQKLRRMKTEMTLKIRDEVKKQLDAGFLAVSKYPQWVATFSLCRRRMGKSGCVLIIET